MGVSTGLGERLHPLAGLGVSRSPPPVTSSTSNTARRSAWARLHAAIHGPRPGPGSPCHCLVSSPESTCLVAARVACCPLSKLGCIPKAPSSSTINSAAVSRRASDLQPSCTLCRSHRTNLGETGQFKRSAGIFVAGITFLLSGPSLGFIGTSFGAWSTASNRGSGLVPHLLDW
jgi:hypothetical protein